MLGATVGRPLEELNDCPPVEICGNQHSADDFQSLGN
jgi:hypothetical protein